MNVVRAPLDGKQGAVFKVLNDEGEEVVRLEGSETEEIKPLPRGTLLEKEESVEEVNVRFVQINFEGTKGWRIDYLGEEHAVTFEISCLYTKFKMESSVLQKKICLLLS